MNRPARLLRIALPLLLLAAAASACGSSEGATSSGTTTGPAAPAAESKPQRVVSLGYTDHDTILQMGVQPIGVREWMYDYPNATGPWASDLWAEDAAPEVFAEEIDLEGVAALRPDLILAVNPGIEEDEYTALSAIAPVVTHPADYANFNTPWREQVETIGLALGEPDKATEIIEDHEARLADTRAEHPEFDGASATIACFYGEDPCAYISGDATNRFLEDVGFDHPDSVDAHAAGSDYAEYSAENVDQLDFDVTVWLIATSPGARPLIEGLPLYPTMKLATEGRSVFIESLALDFAISVSSPLSQQYLLEHFVPMLSAAVDGDPATAVPAGPAE